VRACAYCAVHFCGRELTTRLEKAGVANRCFAFAADSSKPGFEKNLQVKIGEERTSVQEQHVHSHQQVDVVCLLFVLSALHPDQVPTLMVSGDIDAMTSVR
jgi:hypothetical protein